ncbi:competence type IV pilus minor pilin ComGD [Oceanobacillus polygoni]|uniref:Competence protein ComGD n=1 Tax=Oceanobacillus polygoni TaxID=1235259 RepID=A0A9X0YSL2_9BACI|nr:competence type IV pilus minor pilin ComGD [Oceanobacillus polygoni]MBP2078203.1 competence protein ComGD [Oceanobacillus polygoni]
MYQRLKTNNGFTMLEVLFVLAIFSIIIVIFPPFQLEFFEKKKDKQFLETLEIDVLYVQNMSYLTAGEDIFIRFYKDNYKVFQDSKIILERVYPTGWAVDYRQNSDIRFNGKGTFLYPRTIHITTTYTEYRIVFQFGKGRFYIAES